MQTLPNLYRLFLTNLHKTTTPIQRGIVIRDEDVENERNDEIDDVNWDYDQSHNHNNFPLGFQTL